jgi:hypothetical protein
MTRASDVRGGLVEARWSPDGSRFLALSTSDTCVFPAGPPSEPRTACAPLPKVNSAGDTFFANDWSPDGDGLAGEVWRASGVAIPGIVTYSFRTGQYRRVTDGGVSPVWLSDSRRLLFQRGENLYGIDTRNGRTWSVAGPGRSPAKDFRVAAGASFLLSRGDREFYFVRDSTQGDIWQMTIP